MFKKFLINYALKTLKRFLVAKIPIIELREHVSGLVDPICDIVNVLTDKDPDNNRQLMQIWMENKNLLITGSLETACSIITSKIKDKETAEFICQMIIKAEQGQHEIK